MKKTGQNKMIDEIYKDCASANDYTGLFQRIHLDPEEVALFHKMYNETDAD